MSKQVGAEEAKMMQCAKHQTTKGMKASQPSLVNGEQPRKMQLMLIRNHQKLSPVIEI